MSFTLYIMSLKDRIPRRAIFSAFGQHITEATQGTYLIRYDLENESTLFANFDDSDTTDSFSINRPCADDRLLEALHVLLSNYASYLVYPEEELVCRVATERSGDELRKEHPELAEALRLCPTPDSLIGD
jgi:hypothetical protein